MEYESAVFGLAALLAPVLLPALYVFAAIQYGEVDVRYWDHVELIRAIEAYKTGRVCQTNCVTGFLTVPSAARVSSPNISWKLCSAGFQW
jgi:hypothetical protein